MLSRSDIVNIETRQGQRRNDLRRQYNNQRMLAGGADAEGFVNMRNFTKAMHIMSEKGYNVREKIAPLYNHVMTNRTDLITLFKVDTSLKNFNHDNIEVQIIRYSDRSVVGQASLSEMYKRSIATYEGQNIVCNGFKCERKQ